MQAVQQEGMAMAQKAGALDNHSRAHGMLATLYVLSTQLE